LAQNQDNVSEWNVVSVSYHYKKPTEHVDRIYPNEPEIKDTTDTVRYHLAKRFQRRFFRNRPTRKKELLMTVMFVNGSGRNEQSL